MPNAARDTSLGDTDLWADRSPGEGRGVVVTAPRKMADYWNVGTSIALFTALGILLGLLLGDFAVWVAVGAGLGVVVGAMSVGYQQRRPPED